MKKFMITLLVLLAILIGFSIYGGIQMSKEKALEAQTPVELPKQSEVKNFDGSYEVDAEASSAVWTGRKKVIRDWVDRGNIDVKSGEVVIRGSESGWAGTTGSIVFDMTSIRSIKTGTKDEGGSDKLNAHLKSEDFFDVEQYPESKFELESVSKDSAGRYDLTGNLTIKGITKPVTLASINDLDFVDGGEGKAIEARGTVKFNRADFGVKFGSTSFFENLGDKIIEDEVTLDLVIVAIKK